MDEYKVSRFFEAAIDKTKSGALRWRRVSATTAGFANSVYSSSPPTFDVDDERSFTAHYGTGDIILVRDSISGQICCLVCPDENLSYDQVGEIDDATLCRLYNLVYNQFPSTDSFIDQFINGL